MKNKDKSDKKLPIWRMLLAIIIAAVATALIVYGSISLVAKDAISKKMIQRVVSKINLLDTYGEDTVKAINVGIMHQTHSAYTDNLYLLQEQLPDYLNETQIKQYLIQKIAEFSASIISDQKAVFDPRDTAIFFDGVLEHVNTETGIALSQDDLKEEIMTAFGGNVYSSTEKMHIIYPGRAVFCVILGAFMLLGVYFVIWPKFVMASILGAISIIVLFIVLLVFGRILGKVFDLSYVTSVFGTNAFHVWIGNVSKLFTRRAFLALLGLIIPVGVTVAYYIDYIHILNIRKDVN